jgi:adenylate kinase
MLNIVLFGPPGAGKGTQSEKLIDEYQLVHLSTGDILRAEVAEGTELGREAKKLMDEGSFVPDEIVIEMIRAKLDQNRHAKGFIFDGFPRTANQAKALDKLLAEKNTSITKMISLKVTDEELIKRLLLRGEESGRPDDQDEDIIMNRIQEYNEKTAPLEDYYAAQGKFEAIDGIGDINEIFYAISGVIKDAEMKEAFSSRDEDDRYDDEDEGDEEELVESESGGYSAHGSRSSYDDTETAVLPRESRPKVAKKPAVKKAVKKAPAKKEAAPKKAATPKKATTPKKAAKKSAKKATAPKKSAKKAASKKSVTKAAKKATKKVKKSAKKAAPKRSMKKATKKVAKKMLKKAAKKSAPKKSAPKKSAKKASKKAVKKAAKKSAKKAAPRKAAGKSRSAKKASRKGRR